MSSMWCRRGIVNDSFCFEEETDLTLHKSSLFYPGDGFIAYNPAGQIVFRVDSYCPDSRSKDELVLMDSAGTSLLTLHRKKPSLHQRWEGFLGEKKEGQEPIFSIHKSSIIGQHDILAQVYTNPVQEFIIQGSYLQRSCTILYNSKVESNKPKEVVAEIKRKMDTDTNVILGKDVSCCVLRLALMGHS